MKMRVLDPFTAAAIIWLAVNIPAVAIVGVKRVHTAIQRHEQAVHSSPKFLRTHEFVNGKWHRIPKYRREPKS